MVHLFVINSVVMWLHVLVGPCWCVYFALFRSNLLLNSATYWCADKSLALPGRKQAWKHVREARDFNNIEMVSCHQAFFLQGKVPKEIHAILTETLTCFIPGQAKDFTSTPVHTPARIY